MNFWYGIYLVLTHYPAYRSALITGAVGLGLLSIAFGFLFG